MAVPALTTAQHRRRVAELRRAGCRVETRTLPSGDRVVLKKCPPGAHVRPLRENQTPAPNALGYLVLAAFAGAALYAIFRPKPAAAATMTPPPQATACTLETAQDFARLEAWATTKNIGAVYLPATATPPLPANSALARSFVTSGASIVVVTNDGKFWTYDTGEPVESTAYRADFCAFKPTAAVSGIRWMD
jgi:hypothetical protein